MISPFIPESGSTDTVQVSWLGHSMFLIDDGAGQRLITDPYAEYVGYPLPDVEAGIVLVSHGHDDHSNVDLVKGNPVIIRSATMQQVGNTKIEGFTTYHDSHKGADRGSNLIFRWEMQGLTFIHLGDLGHILNEELTKELYGADVVFIPVGGTFTIDDSQAGQVVKSLDPHIAVPMHYSTPVCVLPLQTEEPFAARFERVERVGKQPAHISCNMLPEPTLILIMDYIP